MKRLVLVFVAVVGCNRPAPQEAPQTPTPVAKKAPAISLSMVTSTSVDRTHPFAAFRGEPWKPAAGAQYVKIHAHFDEAFPLGKIEVESCGQPLSAFMVYGNFDEHVEKNAGGGIVGSLAYPHVPSIRSLTFNFLENADLCLKEIRLFDAENERYVVKLPRLVAGSVTASSTLEPADSYDVMNVFDSRFENAWASNRKASGDVLTFTFEQPQKVTALRVWNGYQRSDSHCWSNSRVKTLELAGEGYAETVTLTDVMGAQEVKLPKPFEGKKLQLKIAQAYPGKSYKDLVISELRFHDGDGWFLLDPTPAMRRVIASNRKRFGDAKLLAALDSDLGGAEEKSDTKLESDWTVRLRSDGSLYLEGASSEQIWEESVEKNKKQQFYALGNYEVKEVAGETVKLRIFGSLRQLSEEWSNEYEEEGMDCNGCGRDCNQAASDGKERIFQDEVVLAKDGDSFRLVNVGTKPKIAFDPIELKKQ